MIERSEIKTSEDVFEMLVLMLNKAPRKRQAFLKECLDTGTKPILDWDKHYAKCDANLESTYVCERCKREDSFKKKLANYSGIYNCKDCRYQIKKEKKNV